MEDDKKSEVIEREKEIRRLKNKNYEQKKEIQEKEILCIEVLRELRRLENELKMRTEEIHEARMKASENEITINDQSDREIIVMCEVKKLKDKLEYKEAYIKKEENITSGPDNESEHNNNNDEEYDIEERPIYGQAQLIKNVQEEKSVKKEVAKKTK